MRQPDTDVQSSTPNRNKLHRRSVLQRSVAAFGSFLAWRFGLGQATAQERSSSSRSAVSARSYLPSTYQDYPTPAYLPDGYTLVEVFRDRTDGFGKSLDELAFWYQHTKHPLGFANPLAVYVARQSEGLSLAGTENRTGAPVALTTSAGDSVQASYYDGIWTLVHPASEPTDDGIALAGGGDITWDTTNAHHLTFAFNQFTIGIRAARHAGVDLDELIRVANSMV